MLLPPTDRSMSGSLNPSTYFTAGSWDRTSATKVFSRSPHSIGTNCRSAAVPVTADDGSDP